MYLSSEDEEVDVGVNGEGEGDVNGDGQGSSHNGEDQGGFDQNEEMTYNLRGRNVTKLNEGTTTKSGRRSVKPQQLPLELSPIPKRRGTSKKRGALLTQARKEKIFSYKQRTPRGQVGTGGWMQGLLHFMNDSRIKMADINRWIRAPAHKWIWEDGREDEVDEEEEDRRRDEMEEEIIEEIEREMPNIQNVQYGNDFEHQPAFPPPPPAFAPPPPPPPAFAPQPPPLQQPVVVLPSSNQNAVSHLTRTLELLNVLSNHFRERPETRAFLNPIEEMYSKATRAYKRGVVVSHNQELTEHLRQAKREQNNAHEEPDY